MLIKLLTALGRLAALPIDDTDPSPALMARNYRDSTWAERDEHQTARNISRRAEFDGLVDLFRIPGVPDWMGPHKRRRVEAPAAIRDQPDNPQAMDEIAAAMGALGVQPARAPLLLVPSTKARARN